MHGLFENKWISFSMFVLLMVICICTYFKVCLCQTQSINNTMSPINSKDLPA